MYPGKLEEQPMPLIVTTLWFGMHSSTRAFWTAASTPKSPHPGHQSGSTLPFISAMVNCWLARCVLVAICVFSSDHNLVHGNGEFYLPSELLLHCLHDMVRHEGFAVILADVPVRHEAGFTAQVARKLAAVVVLHDDGVARVPQNLQNRFAMQRHEPADLQLIGRDSFMIEDLAGFFDYARRRTPADQSHIGIARACQSWRRHCRLDPGDLAHALFHHGAPLDRIGELIADQYAVFHVFVRGHGVDVPGHARNGAR